MCMCDGVYGTTWQNQVEDLLAVGRTHCTSIGPFSNESIVCSVLASCCGIRFTLRISMLTGDNSHLPASAACTVFPKSYIDISITSSRTIVKEPI